MSRERFPSLANLKQKAKFKERENPSIEGVRLYPYLWKTGLGGSIRPFLQHRGYWTLDFPIDFPITSYQEKAYQRFWERHIEMEVRVYAHLSEFKARVYTRESKTGGLVWVHKRGVSLWATHMLSIRMLYNLLSFKVPRTIYFNFYFTSRARNSFLFFFW